MKKIEFTTEGRKSPITQIRIAMLKKQSKYLRASNLNYDNLNTEQPKLRLTELNQFSDDDQEPAEMRKKLKSLERTRHLLVWLDNSTVTNSGYLVCLITCLYDQAVFYTDDETIKSLERKKIFSRSLRSQSCIL